MVCGTQAARSHVNSVIVIKMSNLHGIKAQDSKNDEADSESEEDDEKEPELESAMIKHNGAVNRVRVRKLSVFLG